MFLVFLFFIVALLTLNLCVSLLKTGFVAAFFIALGVFILLHALYIFIIWLVSLSVPADRPLEKQNPICRLGIDSMASFLVFYSGVRPVVSGLEKLPTDSRFLFVCNHRSMFDPIVAAYSLRRWNLAFISKPSNMQIPFASRIAYGAGFLALDRDNDRKALKSILTAADYMKRDLCSIAIYPEGTRSKTNELLPFHAGSFKAAQRAKVPVAVACVRGSEKLQRFRFFSGMRVYLDILEVIPAEEVCSMRTDALAARAQGTIQADLDRHVPKSGHSEPMDQEG